MDFSGDIGHWQRRITECPEGAKRRLATYDALELAPGQAVLEIGCGGGALTREIALAVGGEGRAVGLDLNPEQLAAAEALCGDMPAAELITGDATELPFDDDNFDGFAAINTLEYIPEVETALAEAHGVLKRGGRFAAISVLWDLWQYHGPEPGLNRRILDAWRAHCHHQMLPMELPGMLARAGFAGVGRELFTFMNGSLHENTYAYWGAKVVAAFATSQGVSEQDARDWLDQLTEADRLSRFGFVNISVLTTATVH